MKRLVLVRREQALRGGQPLSFLIGLVVALLAGILLLVASGPVSYTHLRAHETREDGLGRVEV